MKRKANFWEKKIGEGGHIFTVNLPRQFFRLRMRKIQKQQVKPIKFKNLNFSRQLTLFASKHQRFLNEHFGKNSES